MGEIVQAGAFGSQAKPVTSPGAALSSLSHGAAAPGRGAPTGLGKASVGQTEPWISWRAVCLPVSATQGPALRPAATRRASGACLTCRDRQARIHPRDQWVGSI